MVISEKQQQANRQNAQKSTGPTTPEGKSAIRFNALTYGLRTRETIFPLENAKEYSDLWDELDAEWQPQTRTERCYLETMVTSQWLLKRLADSEKRIYQCIADVAERFKTLAYVYKQRAQLERSFRTAIADMKQSRMQRKASQPQPPQTAKASSAPAAQPAGPQPPPPDYVMSNGAKAHPAFASPVTPDTR
jgi:hypothetical protein